MIFFSCMLTKGISTSKLLGNGDSFVIYDCHKPSYLDSNKKKVELDTKNELIEHRSLITKSAVSGKKLECDMPTNVWKEVSKEQKLVVFNPSSKKFDFILNENLMRYVLKIDVSKGRSMRIPSLNQSLIVSILKIYHHPRYFY